MRILRLPEVRNDSLTLPVCLGDLVSGRRQFAQQFGVRELQQCTTREVTQPLVLLTSIHKNLQQGQFDIKCTSFTATCLLYSEGTVGSLDRRNRHGSILAQASFDR
jgi:hypothetical protein